MLVDQGIILEAIERYKPRKVFALFSGGLDSLTSTHTAMASGLVDGVVHIATGTGIPETEQYVRDTASHLRWDLHIYRPPLDIETGQRGEQYRNMVLKHGFPGPGAHRFTYTLLKERPLRALLRDYKEKRSDHIILITGVRSQESTRRMGHVEPIQKDGSKVWVAPIHAWSKLDCRQYADAHGLEINPVVDLLRMSGECLCGAFAKEGEKAEIRCWYPQVAGWIDGLEADAKQAGMPSVWGRRPSTHRLSPVPGMLCQDCGVVTP